MGFISPSPLVLVETEQLIYPFSSLLAEFGGVLGLFLGVSFITLWDGVEQLAGIINKLARKDLFSQSI